jgi:hypothetical protein
MHKEFLYGAAVGIVVGVWVVPIVTAKLAAKKSGTAAPKRSRHKGH